MPIGIVTALGFEARALGNGGYFAVQRCGVGGAVDAAVRELAGPGRSLIVSWGTAAALTNDLRAGDLCVPEQVLTRDSVRIPTHDRWREWFRRAARAACPVTGGLLMESACIVTEPGEKRRLHESTGAGALDMESGLVGRSCADLDLPFLAIRAIVDELDDRLPAPIATCIGADGALRTGTLLMQLATHPGQWGAAARLMSRYSRAKAALETAAPILAQCAMEGR